MKFKKTSLLFVLFFVISFAGFSQIDDEEGQMFGVEVEEDVEILLEEPIFEKIIFSRHNFGEISEGNIVEHIFVIKNNSLTELIINEFIIPDGVGIMLVDKVIEAKSEGVFIVTVNKNYIDDDFFYKEIVVKTIRKKPMGVIVTEESIYVVEGKF